ncbi:MAG: hypothetical protein QI199_04465 [Candidatus Korarchaeota archaeon]|nr:hypothetical protein [Candidatus Korarchaeota archaeon]
MAEARRIKGSLVVIEEHGVHSGGMGFSERIAGVLERIYSVRPVPRYVEVHIYGSTHDYISAHGSKPLFPAMHDALLGYPRIHVVQDMLPEDEQVVDSLVLHEAVHSVLHGSPEYYVVSVSGDLLSHYRGDPGSLLTHAASAIKDVDVAWYQLEHGFLDELWTYAAYVLEASTEDLLEASLLAAPPADRSVKTAFLVLLAKRVAPLSPLLRSPTHRSKAAAALERYLAMYPGWVRRHAFTLAREILPSIRGGDLSPRVERLLAWITNILAG